MNEIYQTKPIFEKPKINLTPYSTTTNNNEPRTMNYRKQTQTNPILKVTIDDIGVVDKNGYSNSESGVNNGKWTRRNKFAAG
jgi:hypothetical protein